MQISARKAHLRIELSEDFNRVHMIGHSCCLPRRMHSPYRVAHVDTSYIELSRRYVAKSRPPGNVRMIHEIVTVDPGFTT